MTILVSITMTRNQQLLIEAIEQTDKCLNIGSFTKKWYGNHKCKSSVDDIMNMVKLVLLV